MSLCKDDVQCFCLPYEMDMVDQLKQSWWRFFASQLEIIQGSLMNEWPDEDLPIPLMNVMLIDIEASHIYSLPAHTTISEQFMMNRF